MGTVYLGRHLLLDVPVAVKVFSDAPMRWNDEDLQRFIRGARAAARIQHPNVVPVLNAGREGDLYFLVQRYVEGQTLRDRVDAQGRLGEADVIRIVRDIASGLAAAHQIGIVHRDVKPGNIILAADDTAMLTDFGLARPIGVGEVSSKAEIVGTPYYMSPEQCEGLALDGRSDLYSLGATAYHALTGRPPIPGDSLVAVLRGHSSYVPPEPRELAPGLSPPLSRIVMRLLAKKPDQRYASAEEVIAAVSKVKS